MAGLGDPCLLEGSLVPSICSDWLLPSCTHFPPPPFLLTDAPPLPHRDHMNYKQTCYEEVKDRCTLAEKLGAALSSPWRASLVSPSQPLPGAPGSPRPAHGGCRPPPSCQTGGGWGSQQGEGSPSTPIAKQPPTPTLDLLPPSTSDGSGLPKLLLILIPLGLKQTKFPPHQEPLLWGPVFFLTTPQSPTRSSPFPCCQLLTAIVTLCLSV